MTTVKNASPQELESWLAKDEAILIDVRELSEYNLEHIPGSIHLPLSSFKPEDVPVTPGKTLVFQCASGNRSQRACEIFLDDLEDYNQFDAYNLDGGIGAWKKAGLPVESGSK